MSKVSAGLLLYRINANQIDVLLAHPGGPFFRNKDEGAWSIPKGEIEPDEDILQAAIREFEEETNFRPEGPFLPLTPIRQKGGKLVHAWGCEGNCDPRASNSNTFRMEWPPKSGHRVEFPEVDRIEFFGMEEARRRINAAQKTLLKELEEKVLG